MIPSLWTTTNQPLPLAVITAAQALMGLARSDIDALGNSGTETASSDSDTDSAGSSGKI